jgi:kynurenine formamidase
VHGKIPRRAWVLTRTDWSQWTDAAAFQNFDETGQHTPGPAPNGVCFIVEERDIVGFGTEMIGTDAGQGGAIAATISLPLLHARIGEGTA